jgi:hypothetical protein
VNAGNLFLLSLLLNFVLLKRILFIAACLLSITVFAEDTCYIKVHFLYGSKPMKEYKQSQRKWFGGVLGGHVGIEGDTNKILNFSPSGKFHVFNEKKNKHSHYSIHNPNDFYRILSHNDDSMKKAIVHIPVTRKQKQLFDSLSNIYLKQTPYDYALFGMRCGAASYEILAQLNILPAYSYTKTYTKIFYPKKLRLRLLKKAEQEGWTIEKHNGTNQRRWEQD